LDAKAYEVCQASIIFDASRLSICFKHPFLSMRSLHAGCQMPASCGGSHAADIKLPVIEQASFLRMPHPFLSIRFLDAGCRLNPLPSGESASIRFKHLIFRCRIPAF